MEELKELLINVSDSYYDFVESMLDEATKSNMRKNRLIEFLTNNPETTTNEVLAYVVDDLGLYNDYVKKQESRIFA